MVFRPCGVNVLFVSVGGLHARAIGESLSAAWRRGKPVSVSILGGKLPKSEYLSLDALLTVVRACRACVASLPLGPRPVLQAAATARILIVGQAPGLRVHETGTPWDGPSECVCASVCAGVRRSLAMHRASRSFRWAIAIPAEASAAICRRVVNARDCGSISCSRSYP